MPDVFYAMEFEDFMALRKGWNDKLLFEQYLWKRSTVLILSGLVGSDKFRADAVWPHPWDKAGKTKKMVEYRGMWMTEGQARKLEQLRQNRS